MNWNYVEDGIMPTIPEGRMSVGVVLTVERENKITGTKERWIDTASYSTIEGRIDDNAEHGFVEVPVSKFTLAGGDWDCTFYSGNGFVTDHFGYCRDEENPVRVIAWTTLAPAPIRESTSTSMVSAEIVNGLS